MVYLSKEYYSLYNSGQEKVMTIQIKKGLSEDLLLRFEYKTEYVDKVRTIKNRKWDPLKRCWTVPNNTESIEQIIKMFDTDLIVDCSGLVVTNTLKGKAWEQEIIKGLYNALKIILAGGSGAFPFLR